MEPPANATECTGCCHTYGEHYTSYNELKTGCSVYYEPDERSGKVGRDYCDCKGFMVIYSPKRTLSPRS